MTQIDPAAPVVSRTSAAARVGIRYGMSLVAVLLGSYILINGSWSNFGVVLQQHDPVLAFLFVTQLLFGVVVLVFGVLVAPTSIERRLIAAVIVVVLVLIYAIFQPLYLGGVIRVGIPIRGFSLSLILGPAFLVPLAAAAAWLIIRDRRALSYLFLIATVLIPIILNAMILSAVASTLTSIAVNVLATVIGVGIAWAGRAVSGARSQPIG